MRSVILILCTTVLCACGDTQKSPDSHPVADLVLTNGNVITVDEQESVSRIRCHDRRSYRRRRKCSGHCRLYR